ncbi:manganese efflux pump MntP [Kushneria phosphatilytica]|uniref:Putative manganese efflux pump MntP n=1 Tax=Kushneria phosphatilytica TaxID=657387 RepID=A0A1S1NPY3_9GAMM|nr:manganese efflux pump MntP [Kushneria phosphatilytica]OHV07533.1 hypothetical protein BH688_15020 [Kushneria phosphatilytica]QEL10018.1 manganese efflux pump MntP [Kushneria phosphatilytica]
MTPISMAILALAMSTDAFAASLAKGTALRRPGWFEILRTGLIFGAVETITPLIGWGIGSLASRFVSEWDHWVAFTLLLILGLRMIYEGLASKDETASGKGRAQSRHSSRSLILTAIATSLDAMAVGVGLAFAEVDILLAALAIGLATTLMTIVGVSLGQVLKQAIGRMAEILGGVVLIMIGASILYEHLSGAVG